MSKIYLLLSGLVLTMAICVTPAKAQISDYKTKKTKTPEVLKQKTQPKTVTQIGGVNMTASVPKKDADGDGHVSIAMGGADCDDNDARRYPGNVEIVDSAGRDEDCDYTTFGDRDSDGDGFVTSAAFNVAPNGTRYSGKDCDDAKPWIHPNQIDVFNGIDDNCNGQIDEHQSEATIRRMLDMRQ